GGRLSCATSWGGVGPVAQVLGGARGADRVGCTVLELMSIRSFICAALAVGAVALSGYGLATSAGASTRSRVLDIYSSLPMRGASSAQTVPIVHGIQLALAQAGGV